MKQQFFLGALLSMIVILGSSCKKCTTCTAVDTNKHTIAQQQYCSSSGTNLTTFENSFKTTYGQYASTCKRE